MRIFRLVTVAAVGLLVALEGLLSADNALVMAIMVLGLPKREHQKALRYGLVGGFAFRILATLLAVYLIRVTWVKLVGGLYLAYIGWNLLRGAVKKWQAHLRPSESARGGGRHRFA